MKKRLLAAFSLIPMIIVLLSYAQTSGDPCPAGEPKCYKDLVPYGGHNISASQLPLLIYGLPTLDNLRNLFLTPTADMLNFFQQLREAP